MFWKASAIKIFTIPEDDLNRGRQLRSGLKRSRGDSSSAPQREMADSEDLLLEIKNDIEHVKEKTEEILKLSKDLKVPLESYSGIHLVVQYVKWNR